MKLRWEPEALHKYTREIARLGTFECAITRGGFDTVGVHVFVGTFAGVVVGISPTFVECELAILGAAKRELLRAGAELVPKLSSPISP